MRTVSKKSNTSFWVKHALLGLSIIMVGAVVIYLQSTYESKPSPEGQSEEQSVGKGLSDFYAEYRLSSSKPHDNNVGDFVVQLSNEKEPLEDRLKNMEKLSRPISKNWAGEHKNRTFKPGNTLREALTDFAQNEGMQVIWELDKDFIVKHQFQMDGTIKGSLQTIASAVDSGFDGKVYAYLCQKQRAMVMTETNTQYLQSNCQLVN